MSPRELTVFHAWLVSRWLQLCQAGARPLGVHSHHQWHLRYFTTCPSRSGLTWWAEEETRGITATFANLCGSGLDLFG